MTAPILAGIGGGIFVFLVWGFCVSFQELWRELKRWRVQEKRIGRLKLWQKQLL